MNKIKGFFKKILPTKRRLIQVYAALLFNANLKGFATGQIYKGPLKNICTPGLNCYSCPGASGACPLGAFQNALASSKTRAPYYVFAIILLYGILFGRWICGFLCPMGLIQELLHKIPTPKLKKGKVTRALSFLKYVILVFFVILLPIAYAFRNFPLPGFCKYICPAGTLEGAMGLLSNAVNESYLRMLGPLFTWKFLLMVSIIVGCVFVFRLFCRFLCPLGALYGLFNKISFVGVKVDRKTCTDCGICVGKCKMDIKHVGDQECIFCGECISVCPVDAISWKGPKIMLAPNVIDEPLPDTASDEERAVQEEMIRARTKRIQARNKIVKITVGILMAALLIGALVYYNFFDGKDTVKLPLPEDNTTESTDSSEPNDSDNPDTNDPKPEEQPPYGTTVGSTCYPLTLDILSGNGGTLDIAAQKGTVTVLNFWYTTCGPCVEELPHFYEAAVEYGEAVDIIAVHVEQTGVDAMGWLNDNHPEWTDGNMMIAWDTGKMWANIFNIQACPVTIVLDDRGVISDYFIGSVTKDELHQAIEKALEK